MFVFGDCQWRRAVACRPVDSSSHQNNNNNNSPDVLLPGSLRERGEFCIVELGLMEEEESPKGLRSFGWKVANVEFQRLNDFPE